ncbi:MAG: hypothetical protein IH586_11055 [Anaerolineaceae bacterium]|nr:hypothetical protein [Anaerolineaceae bacterium]
MRLTRETLLKIARDAASQRVKVSRRIICIYLTGSVLDETPLLGGTTDIDLVVIHDSEPIEPREIVRLSDEVHLDISHYDQAIFHQPRHLRTDPWLGPFIYKKPMVLYDTQHWFDFIQASTGAQFLQPEYIIQRSINLFETARQDWMNLGFSADVNHANKVGQYLGIIENAGNALASLVGEPISERRFFLSMPQRLQSLQQAELTAKLVHQLAPEAAQWADKWAEWLPAWKQTYQAACDKADAPAQIHACRLAYYERAISAIWEENITAALWILLRTWTIAAKTVGEEANEFAGWQSALQTLNLDESKFAARLVEMDQTLDMVEEIIEAWAQANGVSSTAEI